LAAPDFSAPFTLTTVSADASEFAIGAVLTQGEKSQQRTIAYLSRKLTPAEINYPVHERELLAIIFALKQWRHYLVGRPFKIQTDHHGLQFIKSTPGLTGRRAHWSELLQEYEFDINYIKGATNVVADALSRRPDLRLGLMFHTVTMEGTSAVLTLHRDLLSAATSDTDYQRTLRAARRKPGKFTVGTDDLLYYQGTQGPRLYVPHSLRQSLLCEAHDTVTSGHLGMDKTFEKLSRRFYWPDMEASVRNYVKTCASCQRNKPELKSPQGLLSSNPVPDRPWEAISMDLITQLPKTKLGHTAIITFVDRLTKMAHFYPCDDNIGARGVAQAFMESVFRLHGLPSVIISDRDPKFTSEFWDHLFRALGTRLNMSTARHPQTDGQSERMNRTIEEMLRAYITPLRLDDWDEHLPALEFAYNDSLQASTGATPFYLNSGQHPRSVLDAALPANGVPRGKNARDARDFQHAIQVALQTAQRKMQAAQDRQAQVANRQRRDITFSEGDQVLLSSKGLNPPSSSTQAAKLQPKYYGPFKILQVLSPVTYRLEIPGHWQCHDVFHVSTLRQFFSDGRHQPPPPPVDWDPDGTPNFTVASLRAHRPKSAPKASAREYLVEWEGYPEEEWSWVPYRDIHHTSAFDAYVGCPEQPLPTAHSLPQSQPPRRSPRRVAFK